MRWIALSFVAFLFAFAVRVGSVSAQDTWVTEVRGYLEEGGRIFSEDGYRLTHEIYTGSLDESARESVTFELDAGREYAILGACDTDCSDLDLILYDPNGEQVDSDLLMDDFPIVSVTPGRAATYRAEVSMATCSIEPCRWGIGIYGR